jgi:hypothetical protein
MPGALRGREARLICGFLEMSTWALSFVPCAISHFLMRRRSAFAFCALCMGSVMSKCLNL